MESLYQRLKELDRDKFQHLCFHLLSEQYPAVDIKQVEGAGGDEGIDIFLGNFVNSITVWQAKAFGNTIGDSQKKQIRESLKRAVRKVKPKTWILMTNIDFDVKSHRWFEHLTESYKNKTRVDLIQGSDIVHELLHRKTLRDHYFPEASLDPTELKKIVSKSGELTDAELEALSEHNLEDYVDRLKARDARFNYEILFRNDLGPYSPPTHPSLLATVQQGPKSINIYARDMKGLQESPPKIALKIIGEPARQKMQEVIELGIPHQFTGEEIADVRSDIPFFNDLSGTHLSKMLVTASSSNHTIKTRVTFANDHQKIEYGYCELIKKRAGTKEIEFETAPGCGSFNLSLIAQREGSGTLKFQCSIIGEDIKAAKKIIDALTILEQGGTLSVFDIEREVPLATAQTKPTIPPGVQRLVTDAARISEFFNVPLKFPANITETDLEVLSLLTSIISRGPVPVEGVTMQLMKSGENEGTVADAIGSNRSFAIELEQFQPTLFGTTFDTGPCALVFSNAHICNPEQTLEVWKKAKVGDAIPMKVEADEQPKIFLLTGKA